MTYDIYHHDDLDGRASAAILTAFFRSRGDKVAQYIPVDFHMEKKWGTMKLSRPSVVVDFLYRPGLALYFDHHITSFRNYPHANTKRLPKGHFWDPHAPSCAGFVLTTLVKRFGFKPPLHFKELAKWVDIVDAARFVSARQAIALKEPALQLMSFIDWEVKQEKKLSWLVDAMSRFPLVRIAKDARVMRVMKRVYKERDKALVFYKTHAQMFGKVVFIDLSHVHLLDARFALYILAPRASYNVILKKFKGAYKLSVGTNPWRKPKHPVNIGKILTTYGGGGHKAAGGLTVPSIKEKEQIIREIIAKLNS